MGSILIRNLDEELMKRLRLRAAQHGRSMSEEAREILRQELPEPKTTRNLYEEIRAIVEPLGGIEIELPPREFDRDPPDFSHRPPKRMKSSHSR
jgi:plasmid stability protein